MISFIVTFLKQLKCSITGHARGTRIETEAGIGTFQCPNCDAIWTRKDRKVKAQ